MEINTDSPVVPIVIVGVLGLLFGGTIAVGTIQNAKEEKRRMKQAEDIRKEREATEAKIKELRSFTDYKKMAADLTLNNPEFISKVSNPDHIAYAYKKLAIIANYIESAFYLEDLRRYISDFESIAYIYANSDKNALRAYLSSAISDEKAKIERQKVLDAQYHELKILNAEKKAEIEKLNKELEIVRAEQKADIEKTKLVTNASSSAIRDIAEAFAVK